jgi:hypothetical protein
MANGPLNYTTTIDPVKTAGECIQRLAVHGASAIGMTYDKGTPTGLQFAIQTAHGIRSYALPVNTTGTLKALQKAYGEARIPRSKATREQAERTSWRVMKDWLEAQLALIEAGVAEMPQVMLPYMIVGDDGQTVWTRFLENEQLALTAGSAS